MMVYPFKLRIFKQHERPDERDDGWLRFDFVFDLNKVQIVAFEEHILFDSESNAQRCVLIFFSDESDVYGCYSPDKFLEVFNTEYKEAYTKWFLDQKMWDGTIVEEKPVKRPWWKFWERLQ